MSRTKKRTPNTKTKTAPKRKTTKTIKKPVKNTRKSTVAHRNDSLKPEIKMEMFVIMLFAVSVLLLLSLFLSSGTGFLGGALKNFLKGCFGLGAYILPFITALWGIVIVLGKYKKPSTSKLLMGISGFFIFSTIVHLHNVRERLYFESVFEYLSAYYKMGDSSNGGLIGAFIGNFLLSIVGRAGAYILTVTSAIILFIAGSGKSLFDLLIKIFVKLDKTLSELKYSEDDFDDYDEEYVYEEYEDDYYYEEDDYEEYEEPVKVQPPKPKKTVSSNNNKKISEPIKKKAFDYIVNQDDCSAEEEKIYLINDILKSKKDDEIPPFLNKPDPDTPKEKPEKEKIPFESEKDIDYNDKDSLASEISVRGVGVEGYVPVTLTTSGEDFVSTAGLSEKDEENPAGKKVSGMFDDDLPKKEYVMPSVELLTKNTYVPSLSSKTQILENSKKLVETLKSFGVEAKVVEVSIGPTVTRYELSPGVGVKVSRISNLADDLALNLAAMGIRIEAPIPGKSVVGIEIPNKEVQTVFLRDVVDDPAFMDFPSKLSFAVGKDIAGNTVIVDIAKMPHLLIAGATGSGKSVCVNTIIASILFKASPDEIKMLMIDPKVVELNVYNGIPHLEIPVVTDPQKAAGALSWSVKEMNDRYNSFAKTGTRDLKGYNAILLDEGKKPLPQIIIIIDELADLMMSCKNDVEQNICRLAQKARAAGIHLIIATQRPSVDVITGLIKANIPSRLAFAVTSGIDSRTILDVVGAEKLLGKGDMLFSPAGLSKPQRIQGAFISDKEVERLVNFIKSENGEAEYDQSKVEAITSNSSQTSDFGDGSDEFMREAVSFLAEKGKASVSMLQRRFRIGYNRAARMMEELEQKGIVGPEDGVKPRKVLINNIKWDD